MARLDLRYVVGSADRQSSAPDEVRLLCVPTVPEVGSDGCRGPVQEWTGEVRRRISLSGG